MTFNHKMECRNTHMVYKHISWFCFIIGVWLLYTGASLKFEMYIMIVALAFILFGLGLKLLGKKYYKNHPILHSDKQ